MPLIDIYIKVGIPFLFFMQYLCWSLQLSRYIVANQNINNVYLPFYEYPFFNQQKKTSFVESIVCFILFMIERDSIR
jgi:hypothetical protein